MTTLYRPVLIESAEQAEALPVGRVILSPGGHPAMKHAPGSWMLIGTPSYRSDEQVIGSMDLVPIEAEEEWKTLHEGAWHLKADEDDARNDPTAYGIRRRYTTDWEETP